MKFCSISTTISWQSTIKKHGSNIIMHQNYTIVLFFKTAMPENGTRMQIYISKTTWVVNVIGDKGAGIRRTVIFVFDSQGKNKSQDLRTWSTSNLVN